MSKVKKDIAEASLMGLLQKIKCGFELETQSKVVCDCEPEFDINAFDDAVDDAVGNIFDRSESDNVIGTRRTNEILENLREHVRDNLDSAEYYRVECNGECNINVPSNIEVGEDPSVGGYEFRTIGGLSAVDFLKSSKSIFSLVEKHSLDIDRKCSFHIHISVPGIRHTYGKNFQRSLMHGVLKQELPECILSRLSSDARRFCQTRISEEKFSFVHFHKELGTWEFRCFGNVSDHVTATKCLVIAVKALQFAYRVQLKLERINGYIPVSNDDIEETIEAVKSSVSRSVGG